MTAFNLEYVASHPLEFASISAQYGLHAILLTFRRILTRRKSHPTNYVTALKSLLLRIFFLKNYRFIYSTPSLAVNASRRIDGNGWWAYEVDADPNEALRDNHIVMLYFHGGGFAIGEPLQYYETYKRWKRKAARHNVRLSIVALRYPLSTEDPYPAQRNAALSAYHHLIIKEQVSPNQIIIAGDSAGGNLVASFLVHLKEHSEISEPAGSVIISGWLDPSLQRTLTSPFAKVDFVYGDGTSGSTLAMAQLFAGEGRNPASSEISPALSENLTGLSNHLCCYGESEVYHEHSKRWIARCKADGVDVVEYVGKGAVHTFCLGGLTADSSTEKESDDVLLNYIMRQTGLETGEM